MPSLMSLAWSIAELYIQQIYSSAHILNLYAIMSIGGLKCLRKDYLYP